MFINNMSLHKVILAHAMSCSHALQVYVWHSKTENPIIDSEESNTNSTDPVIEY